MTEAADIEKDRLQSLHGFMKFVFHMIAAGEKLGETGDPAIIGQPIVKEFRQILEDIPNIDSDEDFKRFALRSENASEVWAASMLPMDIALRNNLPVQHLVDQMLHHPGEMKSSLLEVTADTLNPEILVPILDMFSLLDSDAVDRKKLTDWQKHSGNSFGLARHEGGKAEVSARAKNAVNTRLEQEPTNPIKEMIRIHWAQALKVKGSDNGFKTHFVKRMQELVKADGKGIIVKDRTITDWTIEWGGTLQKIDRPKKRR